MKSYEIKSFLITATLFFLPLLVFSSLVLYMYYEDKVKTIEDNILYQMKDYTYDFHGDEFILDVVVDKKEKEIFKIYNCKEGLCAYFRIKAKGPYLLKVIYAEKKINRYYEDFIVKITKFFLIMFFSILLLSLCFAYYSIKPMKDAVNFLEDFLKDLIHDLNTPATSILLNAKLLKRRGDFAEIVRIELAAKTISSLHKNLEFLQPHLINKNEEVNVEKIIKQRVDVLQKLYPKILIEFKLNKLLLKSNITAVERIFDNLLSNACKYNKKNGKVLISINENVVCIKDTGIGIKNTKKVFNRYYKENDTGLGIGLSIVKKLCDILGIKIQIISEIDKGTEIIIKF